MIAPCKTVYIGDHEDSIAGFDIIDSDQNSFIPDPHFYQMAYSGAEQYTLDCFQHAVLMWMQQEQSYAELGGNVGPGQSLNFQSRQEVYSGQSTEGADGCNVFIFHLPSAVDNYTLYNLFRKFGHIKSSRVIVDFKTGLSRGYGFVSFALPSQANLAISAMNGFLIHRKRLKVALKQDKVHVNSSHTHLNVDKGGQQLRRCVKGKISQSAAENSDSDDSDCATILTPYVPSPISSLVDT